MEGVKAAVDVLASPPWLFTVALVLFLSSRASRRPWTLAAGAALLTAAAAFFAVSLADEGFRRLVLHPERLAVAVLLASSGAVLWLEMHRSQPGDDRPRRRDGPGGGPVSTTDAVAATAVGLALVGCALAYPATLAAPADPATRPDLVKAPWFLTGLQEIAHYFDPWVAYGAVPLLLLVGLLGLPYLKHDDAARPTFSSRRRALFLFVWLFFWLWPMAVGALLRGPGWQAFGPFETWQAGGAPSLEPRALSEAFWVSWLQTLEPTRWWLRELPGLLVLAVYFVLVPFALGRFRPTRGLFAPLRETLGPWRFRVAAAWILALLLVPLKMYGRWWLDLGYWIRLPEIGLNF